MDYLTLDPVFKHYFYESKQRTKLRLNPAILWRKLIHSLFVTQLVTIHRGWDVHGWVNLELCLRAQLSPFTKDQCSTCIILDVTPIHLSTSFSTVPSLMNEEP